MFQVVVEWCQRVRVVRASVALLLWSVMGLCAVAQAQSAVLPAPALAARSWILYDQASGQVLAEHEADTRVEPASLTKMMTAYVTFSAIRDGRIKLDHQVTVSERSWKMGGSRMFIQPGLPVTVEQLIRGMIIQSGNDACVALAEVVAGSEEQFVQVMNREAQRLGLKGTHFANSSGLTAPDHYSTARDMVRLAAAIMRDFPQFYPIYSEREYRYNNVTQENRNRLLWVDPTVDGMKTGHTDAAGYCLVASAKRANRRLISAVMGAASMDARVQESLKLLNYGYLAYDAVRLYEANKPMQTIRVYKGAGNEVKVGFVNGLVLSLPKGAAGKVQAQLVSRPPLLAPIVAGQVVATLKLTIDGKPLADYPVQALEAVQPAGWFGRTWDTLRLWLE